MSVPSLTGIQPLFSVIFQFGPHRWTDNAISRAMIANVAFVLSLEVFVWHRETTDDFSWSIRLNYTIKKQINTERVRESKPKQSVVYSTYIFSEEK